MKKNIPDASKNESALSQMTGMETSIRNKWVNVIFVKKLWKKLETDIIRISSAWKNVTSMVFFLLIYSDWAVLLRGSLLYRMHVVPVQ